jgi:predicted NBD/HSP70 family sugar kinase
MRGGIDLGGTKIEACLFDARLDEIARRRIPTPASSYEELVDALVQQYEWLRGEAAVDMLPLGIGIPGLVDIETGLSLTSNLVAHGRPLRQDLSQRLGFPVPFQNDCKCFALSEANGGAGDGYRTVFGLIIGTGVGGGVCHAGEIVAGHNELPGEVGHLGIPMNAVPGVALPLVQCKCGRMGCYETLMSGPGISRLAAALTGRTMRAEEVAAEAVSDDALKRVLDIWAGIACELFRTLQATIDPDCIVLGGGVSRIPGVLELLRRHMPDHLIEGTRLPVLALAKHGDSSGVRGAAMLAATPRSFDPGP